MNTSYRTSIIGIVAGLLVVAGGLYFYYPGSSPIKPYDASRDRTFIIDLFKRNWYLLMSDYSPNYDVAFMLDNRAPTTKDMSEAGKLLLQTYVLEGKPVGFIAYYEGDLKIGWVLFLGIDEAYRGKGYSKALMNYVIKDFKKRGMLAIRMYTRTDNTKARKLYESLGFKQIWTDGAYLIYEMIPT